ncbi:MAG TPA: hypothetical protein VK695_11385 [Steroidobacteraceae bacterium]|nr:hypothetical protein [Steroidobacteraceae bacterium]
MRSETTPRRHTRLPLLAAMLLAGVLCACESQQQVISEREDNLAAAGFVIKPANTPQRQAMLARLPAHQFVIRQNGDTVHYVYADPLVCGCLYVGTQQAYKQYRANLLAQNLANEQLMSAQAYSDAAWQWDAWGPWGPVAPGFGFVYSPYGW